MKTPHETAQEFIRELLGTVGGKGDTVQSSRTLSKSETLVVLRALDRAIRDTEVVLPSVDQA